MRRKRILRCCAWSTQNSETGVAGFSMQADLRTDSTAAKGPTSRRGAGQVRHVHCPALWLQQAIARRRIRIEKQPGSTLSADVGTRKLEFQRTRCGHCSRDSDVTEVRDELMLHQGGCEHAEGSARVHDELTYLSLLCTEFHGEPEHPKPRETTSGKSLVGSGDAI